jgi:phospholipid/cholesterol/gamma-HCH transport system substrate-binding protein
LDVSRKTEIRVGIVSVSAILLLLIGIMLGKGISWSTNQHEVRFRLASSGGLEPGSPIVVHGVKRGQVVSVSNHNGGVLVTGQLDDVSDLHSDASAVVSILEITGGKKIEIKPGFEKTPFDPAKDIPGIVAADIGSLVTSLGDVSDNAIALVKRLDTLSAALADLARDGTFVNNIKTLASDGAILVSDARAWMQANKSDLTAMVKDLRQISSTLRKTLDKNEPKISGLIDHLERTLSTFDNTLTKADAAFISVDSLVVEVNTVITEVKANKGLLNRIIYDEGLSAQLDSSLTVLKSILQQFQRDGVNVNVGLGHK